MDDIHAALIAALEYFKATGHHPNKSFDPSHSCSGCHTMAIVEEGYQAYIARAVPPVLVEVASRP